MSDDMIFVIFKKEDMFSQLRFLVRRRIPHNPKSHALRAIPPRWSILHIRYWTSC